MIGVVAASLFEARSDAVVWMMYLGKPKSHWGNQRTIGIQADLAHGFIVIYQTKEVSEISQWTE